MSNGKPGEPSSGAMPTPERAPVRRLSSTDLLGAGRELIIDHGVDQYRLRKTRQGKLILTK